MGNISIFDFIITVCGLYMAYNGVIMKAQGRINTGIVLSRNITPDQIKDKEGFIAYMWWKLVLVGLMCAVSGIFNMAVSKMAAGSQTALTIELVANLIFFVLLMVYAVIVKKAQNRFIRR